MKIGILTYHRAENYGALLQAYGLKTYLESLGHDVSFIDYWPDYHKEYFDLFSVNRFLKVGLKAKAVMLYNLLFYTIRKKRKQNLQKFMFEKLGLSQTPKYTTDADCCREFDVVFYGSDQIWRKQGMPTHQGFDFWYFASDNIVASKKIAYAASMGVDFLEEKDKLIASKYLENFNAISVREFSLRDLLSELNVQSILVVDPVFLLTTAQWRKLIKDVPVLPKKYILMYNLLGSNETCQFAENLSKKTKLPIIEITKKYIHTKLGNRYNRTATVEEFLSLIDNAEYVVSNSFHGVAFSIIFEKQFFAIGMGEKSGRVTSLLRSIGLSERYGSNSSIVNCLIPYNDVRKKLHVMIDDSCRFVKNSIC